MSEGVIKVLEKALQGAEKDRKRILDELKKIRENSDKLREIIYKPYQGEPEEELPSEFENPDSFLTFWDATDRALGNTILMVMPPSIFEMMPETSKESNEKEKAQQPIIITGNQKAGNSGRTATQGFWSGIWDYRIVQAELNAKIRREDKPTITTEKVTYDPKAVVYQLIPSLNQIKTLYFRFLRRHLSSRSPSTYLLKLGHMRLQEEMSKYFNVVYPFCYASITFQTEKIRRDKLVQIGHFSRIAQAEAEAMAMSQVYIPPEVRALSRAIQEGLPFHPDGMKVPSSDEVAKKFKKGGRQ
jgi:hypothetical protein